MRRAALEQRAGNIIAFPVETSDEEVEVDRGYRGTVTRL
jgi:hypothetical protein